MRSLPHLFRIFVLLLLTLLIGMLTSLIPPFAQPADYHDFADQRIILGIPHFWNVATNLAFLIVGIYGLRILHSKIDMPQFSDTLDIIPHDIIFAGAILTAFASGYYHTDPDHASLVWDRMAMTVIFAGIVAAIIGERVSARAGFLMLGPLLLLGIGSVLYWITSEDAGIGDLRPYAFIHFAPAIVVPVIYLLFAPRYSHGSSYFILFGIYGLAVASELLDYEIYEVSGRIISGHGLKHLIAAFALYEIAVMLRRRQTIP